MLFSKRIVHLLGDTPTDANTVVFRMHVDCERNKDAARNETNPSKLYKNSGGAFGLLVVICFAISKGLQEGIRCVIPYGYMYLIFFLVISWCRAVYSGDFKWDAAGRQIELFADKPPAAVATDILIAKLRPGQVCSLSITRPLGLFFLLLLSFQEEGTECWSKMAKGMRVER